MKYSPSIVAIIVLTAAACFGQTPESSIKWVWASTQPIKSWSVTEFSARQTYEFKSDEKIYRSGSRSISVKSNQPAGKSGQRGLLMQTIRADAFRGKRMRLSGYLKSENVEEAGLLFRIDGENMVRLGFDGMKNRPVKGSTDWSRYDLVLDVPETAQQIVLGAVLNGAGELWVDDLSFEEVGGEVPVTSERPQEAEARGSAAYIENYRVKNKEAFEAQLRAFSERNRTAPTAPANLNFESF